MVLFIIFKLNGRNLKKIQFLIQRIKSGRKIIFILKDIDFLRFRNFMDFIGISTYLFSIEKRPKQLGPIAKLMWHIANEPTRQLSHPSGIDKVLL